MDKTNDVKGGGGSATLAVPAEHRAAFKIGLLRELEHDGEWLKEQAAEARRWLEKQKYDDPFGCIGGPLREGQHDARVLRELVDAPDDGDLSVEGDACALKHTLEATVRHVAEVLSNSELGDGESTSWGATVAWAAGEAERLNAVTEQHETVSA